MYKRIAIILLLIFIMGCSQNNNPQEILTVTNDEIYLVKNEIQDLINVNFQFRNTSGRSLGPFYIQYHFHHEIFTDVIKEKEYSPEFGAHIYTLEPNETYLTSDNFGVLKDISAEQFQEIFDNNNHILEVQFINNEDEEIIFSHWIQNFSTITENVSIDR